MLSISPPFLAKHPSLPFSSHSLFSVYVRVRVCVYAYTTYTECIASKNRSITPLLAFAPDIDKPKGQMRRESIRPYFSDTYARKGGILAWTAVTQLRDELAGSLAI